MLSFHLSKICLPLILVLPLTLGLEGCSVVRTVSSVEDGEYRAKASLLSRRCVTSSQIQESFGEPQYTVELDGGKIERYRLQVRRDGTGMAQPIGLAVLSLGILPLTFGLRDLTIMMDDPHCRNHPMGDLGTYCDISIVDFYLHYVSSEQNDLLLCWDKYFERGSLVKPAPDYKESSCPVGYKTAVAKQLGSDSPLFLDVAYDRNDKSKFVPVANRAAASPVLADENRYWQKIVRTVCPDR